MKKICCNKLKDKDFEYLISYVKNILIPAYREFELEVEENELKLHHVFSFNAVLAHAIDHMEFVYCKAYKTSNLRFRGKIIKEFDEKYYVEGSPFIHSKFRLVDAVNNSFKHVELEKKRYADLIELYGPLSLNCLKEESGKVYFQMPKYRFDYARVILRNVAIVFDCGINSKEDLVDFLNGDLFGEISSDWEDYDYDDPSTAIDRMTSNCNPMCIDCGEYGDSCECPDYLFNGNNGNNNPDQDPNFDFDDVMSSIYRGYK